MHIFFSGIGGTAIGPLAMIAKQAGYEVSGSDKQDSQYIHYLKSHGLDNIRIGQSQQQIETVNQRSPIDWYVYSSAVAIENPDAPELQYCQASGIKTSKRDEFLNHFIDEQNLKLIAIAGTHGKTTTTAMVVWLLKQLGIPVSYSVGAKIPYGDMGEFNPDSKYFVLEADEFDRNFLAFHPYLSLITGIDWDHHEIFPTRTNYQQAFTDFIHSSKHTAIWLDDAQTIGFKPRSDDYVISSHGTKLKLVGAVNRQDAWQVIVSLQNQGIVKEDLPALIDIMNRFPGLSRRFEKLADNLYTDYAHTPAKIRGCIQTALEVSPDVVVVYEPLTNRRQHFIKDEYKDLFTGIKKLYWVPSYLAREDQSQEILSPAKLIEFMDNKQIAQPAELNEELKKHIDQHRTAGDLVVCISGGGGGSLDEWARQNS